MNDGEIDRKRWRSVLGDLCAQHGVPGAVLGVARVATDHVGSLTVVARGVLNRATGVRATPDSVFQIGSITKVWTATLIMQLVDSGRLDLDEPLGPLLPEFSLGARASGPITIRRLLTHTSGLDSDIELDTGRGDGCLARYVTRLSDFSNLYPAGQSFSYSNPGYIVLGRLLERISGLSWDRLLRQRLIEPLGLSRTSTLPEDALLQRAAVGHITGADGRLAVTTRWALPRSDAPAGAITTSVSELLTFVGMHLRGGRSADGDELLSAGAAGDMRACHAKVPDPYYMGESWGLGWARFRWNGQLVIGHDGGTIGQSAFLRAVPALGLVVALFANGGNTRELSADIFRGLFEELAGLDVPDTPQPAADRSHAVDCRLGTYIRAGHELQVVRTERGLTLRSLTLSLDDRTRVTRMEEYPMTYAGGDVFVVRATSGRMWIPVTFYSLADGTQYLHHRLRAHRHVS